MLPAKIYIAIATLDTSHILASIYFKNESKPLKKARTFDIPYIRYIYIILCLAI